MFRLVFLFLIGVRGLFGLSIDIEEVEFERVFKFFLMELLFVE